MQQLIKHLNHFAPLEEDLATYLRKTIKTSRHKKGDYLVRPDEIARRISFIEEGIVRGYRLKDNFERTYYILTKDDIFIAVRSFFSQQPAQEYIQCMEDCTLHSISFDELKHAYTTYPSFNYHRAELLQKYYLQSVEREDMHQLRSFDRFCWLMKNQPNLVKLVEDQYLASYLNMAVSTFSRNKSQYAKKKR